MKISGISTPALILDVNTLKANAEKMEQMLKGTKLQLRPHYKSHKCAALAAWQVRSGAIGMTCAKLSEAEDLCDAGIEDILLANQVTDPVKIRRLADLAGNCRLTVCVDNAENIKALGIAAANCGNTVHCLVEYDIGMGRCGAFPAWVKAPPGILWTAVWASSSFPLRNSLLPAPRCPRPISRCSRMPEPSTICRIPARSAFSDFSSTGESREALPLFRSFDC